MAKFLPGPVVSEVRGSVGGTTFTRNRFGPVMRQRVKPVVSTTEYALAAKARMTTETQAWQGLTAAQKLAWNEYAAGNPIVGSLGEQQIGTGHIAFVGINTRIAMVGTGALLVPPVGTPPAPLSGLTLTADIGAGNVEVAYTPTPTGATERLWIRACVVSSSGINYVSNLLRWIITSGGAEASPYDFELSLVARIGTPQVGQTMHVRVSVFDTATGLLSPPLSDRVVVTTT